MPEFPEHMPDGRAISKRSYCICSECLEKVGVAFEEWKRACEKIRIDK
jgi:hypothetical protein